jgi:hypothetical protein
MMSEQQSNTHYTFCWQAAEAGNVDELQRIHEDALKLNIIDTSKFSMLDYMILAAQYRHTDCFFNTCAFAVKQGHLDCLRYAHEHGCEINFHTIQTAANNNDHCEQSVQCFEYCYEKWYTTNSIWENCFNPIIPYLDLLKCMYRFLFTEDLNKYPELQQAIHSSKQLLQKQQHMCRMLATNHDVCNDVIEKFIIPYM